MELSDKLQKEALVVHHKDVPCSDVTGEGFPAEISFLIRGQELMSESLPEVGVSRTGSGVCFIVLGTSLLFSPYLCIYMERSRRRQGDSPET